MLGDKLWLPHITEVFSAGLQALAVSPDYACTGLEQRQCGSFASVWWC